MKTIIYSGPSDSVTVQEVDGIPYLFPRGEGVEVPAELADSLTKQESFNEAVNEAVNEAAPLQNGDK